MAQWTLWGAGQLATSWFSRSAEIPQNFYLALVLEAEPDAFMTAQELDEPLAEDGYARVEIPNDTANWASNLSAVITNVGELRFPTATIDWGTANFWALCSAPEGGYMYLFGEFVEPLYVAAADQVVIDPGLVQLEFSDIYEELAHE